MTTKTQSFVGGGEAGHYKNMPDSGVARFYDAKQCREGILLIHGAASPRQSDAGSIEDE